MDAKEPENNSNVELSPRRDEPDRASPWLGVCVVGVALAALFLAKDIQGVNVGSTQDPGPRLFPIGLSVLLLAMGLMEMWKGRARQRSQISNLKSQISKERPAFLLAAIVGYLGLLYVAGFALATLLFTVLATRFLGTSWKRSAIAGPLLVGGVHLLFVRLFKVPLPEGLLGLPF